MMALRWYRMHRIVFGSRAWIVKSHDLDNSCMTAYNGRRRTSMSWRYETITCSRWNYDFPFDLTNYISIKSSFKVIFGGKACISRVFNR